MERDEERERERITISPEFIGIVSSFFAFCLNHRMATKNGENIWGEKYIVEK